MRLETLKINAIKNVDVSYARITWMFSHIIDVLWYHSYLCEKFELLTAQWARCSPSWDFNIHENYFACDSPKTSLYCFSFPFSNFDSFLFIQSRYSIIKENYKYKISKKMRIQGGSALLKNAFFISNKLQE